MVFVYVQMSTLGVHRLVSEPFSSLIGLKDQLLQQFLRISKALVRWPPWCGQVLPLSPDAAPLLEAARAHAVHCSLVNLQVRAIHRTLLHAIGALSFVYMACHRKCSGSIVCVHGF